MTAYVKVDWIQKAWRDFQESADPDELVASSSPSSTALGVLVLVGTLLALAYVPSFATVSELDHVWYAVALILCGNGLTYVAWAHRCRGPIGSFATLFDNAFYSAGLVLAAVSSAPAVGIALAVIQGLMLVAFPGRAYALTSLFAVVMAVPPLLAIAIFRPALPVALVLLASLGTLLLVSQYTRVRRLDKDRQLRLEQALGAADRLVDESVQTALTTTLLTLGHFLHEMRNYQTALAANLEFVDADPDLSADARSALAEAQEAQKRQTQLLRATIEDLRSRSKPSLGAFNLRATLDLIVESHGASVTVEGDREFEISGNPENLRVVFLNLIRNAEQAGATQVTCSVRVMAGGNAVELVIQDNGAGIPPELRARLFETFAVSTKPGGSGLGLYLVRRHVELLGGRIRIDGTRQQDTSFVIRLPGQLPGNPESEPSSRDLRLG